MGNTSRRPRRLFHAAAVPMIVGIVLAAACSTPSATTGPGVTSAPCPNAIDRDKGCIYLGVLSDLGGGPFAMLGRAMQDGQTAFWTEVNKAGGIGGYEVDISTYARDTAYDPHRHVEEFREIEPNVLALAMSLGTAQTLAVLQEMDAADIVTSAGTLWSGWEYRETDRDLVLDSGYSYCTEAIMGLDWFTEHQYRPRNVAVVAFRGNYGGDYANGALRWAAHNNVTVTSRVDTGPNTEVGNQDRPVAEILANPPDLVLLATGPAETAEIIGKLVAGGFHGRFLGSAPTWNGALLKTPAGPALSALFNYTSPVDGWDGRSTGARRARAAAPQEPTNWGYSLGWAGSYTMRALLTKAAEHGPLNRAGVRAAQDALTVDFEGMAAPHTYNAGAPDYAAQRAAIGAPDPSAPLGSRTVTTDYRGPTLPQLPMHGPCARL
ncbi:ABC-type branched-chain amino acid transport system, substrate-binding protein [Nocardia amikacinitolerans]|uniref:ABC transporter substrate-binding protein n=1 Tax=Nocardia amikacinitolerans TaxID=756689 RepID=UPI00083371BB|nr:ABC transporter substrate-binding protein [Nocardia amikacinitolerans]MCP2321171.1 ABC-type branched-chain amino acid transport system, substrate-binding protein [Nocardia amikacinitolerans]